jgi:hypothetical protein
LTTLTIDFYIAYFWLFSARWWHQTEIPTTAGGSGLSMSYARDIYLEDEVELKAREERKSAGGHHHHENECCDQEEEEEGEILILNDILIFFRPFDTHFFIFISVTFG